MTNRVSDRESGYRFRRFCKERGLTAKAVAELTGLSKNTIWQYFQGTRYPSRFTKALLSEKLGYNMEEIFRD